MIELWRQRVGWIYRMRSIYLFASLLLFIAVIPVLDSSTVSQKILINLFNVLNLVAAIAAVGRTRQSFVIALLFTLPILGLQVAGLLLGAKHYLVWSWSFGALFYATTLMYLLRYVFSTDVMSADKLFGAGAAYMLLGMLWMYFYGLSQHFHPGAFALHGVVQAELPVPELIYFSFTTLTTTGFGDFVPLHPATRALANLQQICGTLFVAILIARLAGIYPERDR
ncbi:ion channel [Pseudomonas sp. N040]|uniref:ion channel n=1 Tax=Pseudomonas sp. N040 TaxID=2785325 RepID=UPI0018A29536|nr:ion channel [Pseudomonas sp. N040]MBF7729451.1 voltage-gated potassium channel [Pseudomonas sp. N040]MBW7013091.1 voltage-gated potassium channel [Pseudomonas sp. N040]